MGEDLASIASYQFTSVEVKEKAFRLDGVFLPQADDKTIAILNENGTGGHRGTAPVLGSGKFLYAYGTQADVNQVGLL
ncbi:DUF2887 domain-containing protein [Gloeomargaritales cyanobacterium VI4D9]|nr:DUF2887 domain-containing protein [Gloeomargaritales cyanobacterium VI4D9]